MEKLAHRSPEMLGRIEEFEEADDEEVADPTLKEQCALDYPVQNGGHFLL